jgi:site-specific DNA-methyltransferase (cytosine-N4-specific)
MKKVFSTRLGRYLVGSIDDRTTKNFLLENYEGRVQLILTSPPFPLNAKKEYGNLTGSKYKEWFAGLAPLFSRLLKKDGSIIIEIGNAWEPKKPIQSLLPLESLMYFVQHPKARLRLCQEFICYNPARLPSPAQWVTVDRIRVTDSYTRVWWMAKSDNPKADNSRVLRPYSKSMQDLLKSGTYNAGRRPSEHVIGGKSFLKNNKGSIMHNVIPLETFEGENVLRLPKNVLRFANTSSNDYFSNECRRREIQPHPARMPLGLASFFVEFLTDPGDIVLDPFAGTNTTGYCAEKLGRGWVAIEIDPKYGKQSVIRLRDPLLKSRLKLF